MLKKPRYIIIINLMALSIIYFDIVVEETDQIKYGCTELSSTGNLGSHVQSKKSTFDTLNIHGHSQVSSKGVDYSPQLEITK
jgi:hypothetical protein